MPAVTIKNLGKFQAQKYKSLLDFLVEKRIPINASCGGRGRCGFCRVKILKAKTPNEIESALISQKLLKTGYRLACQYRIDDDIEVIVSKPKVKEAAKSKGMGLALDLGTTTIKGALVDLKTGKIREKTTVFNPQNSLGGDVMTRISAALEGNYKKLWNLLLFGIEQIEKQFAISKPIFTTVVGNPVMLSFYLNKPVRGLAQYPFQAEIKAGNFLKNPSRYVFPIIGGFVGGDTIAGILASKITHKSGNFLYIDLGTNGEIAFVTKEKVIATSAAAGPAFEGVGISSGSLAIPGAIDRVTHSSHGFKFHTIGNRKAKGFCASGLIDLLATLLNLGWLREDGRLVKKIDVDAFGINQEDIRKLQLAIGAIHTGIQILLEKMNVRPSEIEETILTGEFGSALYLDSLVRIGLLPKGIKQLRFEKDLPLKGAVKVLLDNDSLMQIEKIEKMSEYLELALVPNFQKKFFSSLRLAQWG